MYHPLIVLLAAICEFLFILRRFIYKHSVLVSVGNVLIILHAADEPSFYLRSIAVCSASDMSKHINIYFSSLCVAVESDFQHTVLYRLYLWVPVKCPSEIICIRRNHAIVGRVEFLAGHVACYYGSECRVPVVFLCLVILIRTFQCQWLYSAHERWAGHCGILGTADFMIAVGTGRRSRLLKDPIAIYGILKAYRFCIRSYHCFAFTVEIFSQLQLEKPFIVGDKSGFSVAAIQFYCRWEPGYIIVCYSAVFGICCLSVHCTVYDNAYFRHYQASEVVSGQSLPVKGGPAVSKHYEVKVPFAVGVFVIEILVGIRDVAFKFGTEQHVGIHVVSP